MPSSPNPPELSDEQDARENGIRSVRQRVHGSDTTESAVPQREKLLTGQRSAPPAGGNELDHPPDRAAPGHTVDVQHDASQGANGNTPTVALRESTPWPGRDFRLKKVLPGSVYLWACDERGDGDGTSPVSRPERWAAWVVLLTQFLCYVELWVVSGDRTFRDDPLSPGSDEATSSSFYDAADYSIVAISVAMYLVLSIVAADLWGGLALVLEGRGPSDNFTWFTSRRLYGACLLTTFGALVGASTRVLFYSSFENVDWVLGAAAVLFIADVDEKAMGVLRNVGGGWRLFWVFQAVGSSFGLAVLVVKLTESADTVQGGDSNRDRCESWFTPGCSIYDWYFVFNMYPLAVTAFSLLVTRAASRPESSVEPAGSPGAPSRRSDRLWLSLTGTCWVLYRALPTTVIAPQDFKPTVSTAVGVVALFTGGIALSCGCGYFCRRLKSAYARGSARFRTVDRKRR
eukprot:g3575.t1